MTTWTVIEKRNDQALDTFSTKYKALLWIWLRGFWRFQLEEGSATLYRRAS